MNAADDEPPSGPLDFDSEQRSAARRAAELEEPPPPPRPPPPRVGGGGRYGWIVGILAVVAIAYITLNTIRTEGQGSRGVPAGSTLPPFAMPLAGSSINADANIATGPDQGRRGRRPACAIRGPQILNVCELRERGPVALAFLATRGASCKGQLDLLERVRPEYPGVQMAAVSVRGDRGDLRETIREHGWHFPVGYDRDGAVANVYGVTVCPTMTFALPGGRVRNTTLGELDERELRTELDGLVRAARAGGWSPPT